jgi:GntR family transcriptional regulator, transcriptional repressor for pyruvate dehydrogenase complex
MVTHFPLSNSLLSKENSMAFQRIDRSRRFIQVSKQLRQSIFNGDYKPGQRLPNERNLADIFGVSRIIIREAIWDLKRSGLVDIKRGAHGGAFVQEMKHDAVTSVMADVLSMTDVRPADVIEVRLLVEPAVAALAAGRATVTDIKEMREYLEHVPKVQTDEYVRWQIGFHRLVAKASHNPLYGLLVNILLDFAEDMILSLKASDRILHDTTSHPEILDKISNGDAAGVQNFFKEHLLEIKSTFDDWEKNFGTNVLKHSTSPQQEQI